MQFLLLLFFMLAIFYSKIFKKNGMTKECDLVTTHKLTLKKNMSVAHDHLQTSIKICIAGIWTFQIAATNEYGSTGDYSNPTLFNIRMNCPSKLVDE